jgi:hypothetical protein
MVLTLTIPPSADNDECNRNYLFELDMQIADEQNSIGSISYGYRYFLCNLYLVADAKYTYKVPRSGQLLF